MRQSVRCVLVVEGEKKMDERNQWEYCVIRSNHSWARGGGSNSTTIQFQGAHSTTHDLNPIHLDKVLGLLGQGGWELVSVTATLSADEHSSGGTDTLYLKRPVMEGRDVDKPELVL